MVDSTSSTGAAGSAGTGSSVQTGYTTQSQKDQDTLLGDFDTFLKLLITQLKNQDPLSPMDSTEFTNQLVQYANVEQAIKTNSNLETIAGIAALQQGALVSNYLDRWVEAPTDALPLQDGSAMFTYTLPEEAASVKITLTDLEGKTLYAFDGATEGNKVHKVVWDGVDSEGNQLADGVYRVKIDAKDSKGESIKRSDAEGNEYDLLPTVVGKVTAYHTDRTGGTRVLIGSSAFDLTDIVGVFLSRPEEDAKYIGKQPADPETPDPETPDPETPDPGP